MAAPNEHGHPITALDQGPWVTIMTALMMTYMILFHLARLIIRYTINGPFGVDDHVISVGVVSILRPLSTAVGFCMSSNGHRRIQAFGILQSAIKLSQANAGLGKSISIVDHSKIEQIQKVKVTPDLLSPNLLLLQPALTYSFRQGILQISSILSP